MSSDGSAYWQLACPSELHRRILGPSHTTSAPLTSRSSAFTSLSMPLRTCSTMPVAYRSRVTRHAVLTPPTAPASVPPEGPRSHCIQHATDGIDSFCSLGL